MPWSPLGRNNILKTAEQVAIGASACVFISYGPGAASSSRLTACLAIPIFRFLLFHCAYWCNPPVLGPPCPRAIVRQPLQNPAMPVFPAFQGAAHTLKASPITQVPITHSWLNNNVYGMLLFFCPYKWVAIYTAVDVGCFNPRPCCKKNWMTVSKTAVIIKLITKCWWCP